MKNRRGVALLAALWLVIAIVTVALQFSLEARERRTIGILASERGQRWIGCDELRGAVEPDRADDLPIDRSEAGRLHQHLRLDGRAV